MTAGGAMLQSRPKRLLAVVAAAAMVGVAGVGCGSSGSSSSSSGQGPVTLEFAQWWGGELPQGSFEKMMSGQGQKEADAKQFETIMQGYHDLVDHGRREIYKLEG